ncbi:MAG: hypothetical protein QOH76_3582 [Thermoleophilaceae bacterium]|jgi:hypothetical protein|nr:hypothetical protein [Thermoleophilaceae bacterium]
MHPLQRIEDAITSLAQRLRPVDALPSVQEELEQVNRTLGSILAVLEEIRDGLGGAGAAAAKRPAA